MCILLPLFLWYHTNLLWKQWNIVNFRFIFISKEISFQYQLLKIQNDLFHFDGNASTEHVNDILMLICLTMNKDTNANGQWNIVMKKIWSILQWSFSFGCSNSKCINNTRIDQFAINMKSKKNYWPWIFRILVQHTKQLDKFIHLIRYHFSHSSVWFLLFQCDAATAIAIHIIMNGL